ncbi:ATP-binding protein [Pedobacter sp.]|uniref:tetratricopeptide repeat-containing sensor histidine kinase n=1 Tax=Pedobacter sp. TaxID=1411316 RepID=UPI0031D5238A
MQIIPSKKIRYGKLFWLPILLLALASCKDTTNKGLNHLIDSVANKTSWGYNDEKVKTKALKTLRQALDGDQKLSAKSKFDIYNAFYFYYFFGRKYEKALPYTDSMLNVIEATKDKKRYIKELAGTYYCKGDVLFRLGAYEEAYKNYFLAKKLQPVITDRCANSNYSYRIAMILYRQSKYTDAIHYFQETLEEVRTCKQNFQEVYKQQELFNNIALCYSKLSKADSALVFYQKALTFIEKNDTVPIRNWYYKSARGVIYGNMGGELLSQKKFDEAEKLLKQSIAINDQPKYDTVDAVTAKIKLIKVYLETNQTDSAFKYLKILEKDSKRLKMLDHIQSYHFLNAKYLSSVGQNQQAFDHLYRYTTLTDSLQKELDKIKSTNIDERFRNLNNENEINNLKREAEIQQRYLYITLLFICMAVSIVVLIYNYWRKSRRNVKQLTTLNNEISLQKDKLQEALIKLGLSDKEKDTILRAVAHDLRNPVVGISSLTKLMILEDEENVNIDKLKLIDGACSNALHLIDDIIEAAENKEGLDITLKKNEQDLIPIVKNAIELLKYRADEKKQLIVFETDTQNLAINIYGQKIERVVGNLISNAIKFSEIGKEIKVKVEKKQNEVLVSVTDKGIGIPDKIGKDIFQLFTPSKRFGTKGEKSYGLGLSICKQIITAHEGEIGYKNNPGGGTTFSFTLPLV